MTTDPTKKLAPQLWDVSRLKPYAQNAKKHPPEQLEKLARSIAKFGLANPPNVKADGEIITGHGRFLAISTILKWEKIPVYVRDDLTDAEADALRISDNQTSSNEYDTELLQQSIMDLSMTDIDMDALGFDEAELTRMTSDFGDIDANEFVDDISTAVEEQKTQNIAKEAEIDQSAAPVSDALGFKRVTVEQSRRIRELMTAATSRLAGKTPAEILIAALELT